MNQADKAEFQQAMNLTNSGQKMEAYTRLQVLAQRNANNYDPDLLLWLAFTTPYPEEARRTLNSVMTIAPHHPGLASAQAYQAQYNGQPQVQIHASAHQQRPYYYAQPNIRMGPVLLCPHCHTQAPARIERRTSKEGWIIFILLVVLFFPLCWIVLFIKEDYYVCSYCQIQLN